MKRRATVGNIVDTRSLKVHQNGAEDVNIIPKSRRPQQLKITQQEGEILGR